MLGAVLGGVIVAVIYNGLELLGLGAAPQYIWTAAVLLAAVTVDTTRPPRPDSSGAPGSADNHYSERSVVHDQVLWAGTRG